MTTQKNQETCKFQCKAQTLTGTWTHRNTDNTGLGYETGKFQNIKKNRHIDFLSV